MRSILEKALVHLLNEENEQADALFHKYMVAKAKQIHESLRQGDDALLESFDEINSDEMFTENDLDGLEDGVSDFDGETAEGEAAGDLAGADADMTDATADVAGAEADLSDEMGVEGEPAADADAGSDTEDRMAALMDKLERLTAEFEEKLGDVDADETVDGDVDGEAEFGDAGETETETPEFGGDVDGEAEGESADGMGDDMQKDVTESEDMEGDEDEYTDLDESIINDLEKVLVSMQDGKEIGAGKTFQQNTKSAALQGKPDPMKDGKPVQIKASEHKGFERETAPAVKDMKKRKNTKSKSDEGRSTVSKEGDKGASINKDFAGSSTNDKSTLISR